MAPLSPHQPPSFFVRGPSPFARLVAFATLSLLLMVVDARWHYLVEVRQGCATLMYPLEMLATSPYRLYLDIKNRVAKVDSLNQDVSVLHEQNMRLSIESQHLKALEAENQHLRQLMNARQVFNQPTRLAEIMHTGRNPFVQSILVNVGAQQGVSAGQAVVDGIGVIGQVTRVFPFSSEITLITDRDLAVPVQVERNSLRAIVFGHGRDNALDLPYLPVNVDIREGDKLVTSGIDGIYPMGLAVAIVKRVERNQDSPFAKITCIPVAGTEQHRQVLILQSEVLPEDVGNDVPPSENKKVKKHATRKH